MLPNLGPSNSAAIVFLNQRTDGTPTKISVVLHDIGLTSPFGYKVQELFDGFHLGVYQPNDTFTVTVNPSGNYNILIDFICVISSACILNYLLIISRFFIFLNRCCDG